MDGTLVDSGASVLRAWRWLATELDQPFELFAEYLHGIPAGQVLAEVLPDLPADQREQLASALNDRQVEDTSDVIAVAGALAALDALPTARWAVVTSAPLALARSRIQAAGLPLPRNLITSETVQLGKPAPDPYLAAIERIGVPAERCLVVEDSVAGVTAGVAAGCPVLGVLTTSDGLDGVLAVISDLSEVAFTADRLAVSVTIEAIG